MIRIIFAFCISIVCISSFIAVTLFSGLVSVVQDREFYTTRLVDFIYDDLIDVLPEHIDLGDFEYYVESNELAGLLRQIVSKDDFSELATEFINDFDELVVNENSEIAISLDLTFLAEKEGEMLLLIGDLLADSLPSCSSVELLSAPCFDDGLAKEDYDFYVQSQLRGEIFPDFSEEFVFTMPVPDDVTGNVSEYFQKTFFYAFLMNSLFVLALFFFFGLCIFSPFTRVLFWEGMLLLISSLFLLLALFGLQSVDSVYFSYMDSPAAELILPFFFHELSSHLFPWNFGFIMFSFLLFIVSFILKRRNESL